MGLEIERWSVEGHQPSADVGQHGPGAGHPYLRAVPVHPRHPGQSAEHGDVEVGIGEGHRRRPPFGADDGLGRAVGHHPAPVEDDDVVTQALGLLDVVGDEDDGDASVADAPHDFPGATTAQGVEVLGQLVEEHELRSPHQSQRHEQPLALTAGEGGERAAPQRGELPLLGELVEGSGGGVQQREQPQRLADPEAIRERGMLKLRPDVAAEPVAGHGGIEAQDGGRPRIGAPKSLEDLDRRRLPGAVGAEEPEQLAPPDGERDAAQDSG